MLVFNLTDNHKIKKIAICCNPTLECLLSEAKKQGLAGQSAFFENGCEITSDLVLAMSSSQMIVVRDNNPDISCFEDIELTTSLIEPQSYGTATVLHDFDTFEIPWNQMSEDIIEALNLQQKMFPRQITEIVATTHKSMRSIQRRGNVKTSTFRLMVHKMCRQYPDSFLEKSGDGSCIPDTADYIIKKFCNKDYYFLHADENADKSLARKVKSKNKVLKDTVNNYEGQVSSEPFLSLVEKKKWLQCGYLIQDDSVEQQNRIQEYMGATFHLQRQFLNNNPEIAEIKKEWPFLLEMKCILQHIYTLLGFYPERIIQNITLKTLEILQYAKQRGDKKCLTFFEKTTEPNEQILMMKFLFFKFKEEQNTIFKQYEFGTTIDSIKKDLKVNSPFLAIVLDPNEQDKKIFYLIVEQTIINDTSANFAEAMQQLLCVFFVYNMFYPEKGTKTMIFFQRHMADFWTTKIRCETYKASQLSAANGFIRILNNFTRKKID